MATYSIATAALALGTDRKHVENMLRRCRLSGADPGRQGQARRLRRDTIVALACVLQLEEAVGAPAPTAASLLRRLWDHRSPVGAATVRYGAVAVSLDFEELERSVRARLAEALEIAPRPARGRPRNRKGTRAAGAL
jgi:hypothetical protein